MPIISVKVIENLLSDGQKEELVTRLTDGMAAVVGDNLREATWVLIDEVKSGNVGIGGQKITTEAVLQMQKGAAV